MGVSVMCLLSKYLSNMLDNLLHVPYTKDSETLRNGGVMKTYRIENTKGGVDFGLWQADSAEEALEKLGIEAGYRDGIPDPEIDTEGTVVYEVATVQMVDRDRAEEGYIEMGETPEDLDAWIDSLCDYDVTLVSGASGWGEYTHLVRLDSLSDDGGTLYYLVPSEAIVRLRLADLVALGDVAKLAGVEKDTVIKWIARHPGFPSPVVETSAGKIWQREDVIKWLKATGRR